MAIGREDAAQALKDAETAAGRSQRLHRYRGASDFLFLWGVIWTLMDLAYYFDPAAGNWVSLGCDAVGIAGSVWLGLQMKRGAGGSIWARAGGAVLIMLAIAVFSLGVQVINPSSTAGQGQAIGGLAVGCAYIVLGAGQGLRIAAVGVAMAALTLAGWAFAREQFMLWMAVAGGGGLILGGWWLRTV
jgi:hypothetical protein